MTRIGIEEEFLLVDRNGRIANEAETILADPRNDGSIVKESSYAVVEINTAPARTLDELAADERRRVDLLTRIADAHGLRALPVSVLGPDAPTLRTQGRYGANTAVRSEALNRRYASTLGLHIHLDKRSTVADQYNLLLSADPAFAFLSTSPYLLGQNTMNDRRVYEQRYVVFRDHPLHGQLPGYARDEQELDRLDEERLAAWTAALSPEQASFYALDNTNWGPIRRRQRTQELRNSDTSIHSLVMAQAALYRGLDAYVFEHGLAVQPGEDYGLAGDTLIIPSERELRLLEQRAIKHGLRDPAVHAYLSHLVALAHDGLSNEEQRYLRPFETMLATRTNLADVLACRAESEQHVLSREAAASVNEFYAALAARDRSEGIDDVLRGVASEGVHYFAA